MNNKVSRLSLSLCYQNRKEGGTGLTCRFSETLCKGGLRHSESIRGLSDCGVVAP